jgi:ring-1,2-phenylacetyl-CoA epoxidase subunit PaaD
VTSIAAASRIDAAWRVLDDVLDPEVPVLSVRDLGIVRDVVEAEGGLEVVLTPTYLGCPATEAIERGVVEALDAAGLGPVKTSIRRAPAWTTDWIGENAKRKLRQYGIAPPHLVIDGEAPIRIVPRVTIECPRCGSANTERLSAFGATACKALYRCIACREPFEHFKPI